MQNLTNYENRFFGILWEKERRKIMGSLKVREEEIPGLYIIFSDPAVCGRVYVLYGI